MSKQIKCDGCGVIGKFNEGNSDDGTPKGWFTINKWSSAANCTEFGHFCDQCTKLIDDFIADMPKGRVR